MIANLNKNKIQTLKCDKCNEYMCLEQRLFHETFQGTDITITNLPLLICEKCGLEYLPDKSKVFLCYIVNKAQKNGHRVFSGSLKPYANEKRYNFARNLGFLYNSIDYDYIPGLMRPLNDGFLTPVFFNKSVLIKYLNKPGYTLSLACNTYGSIYKDHEHLIAFGINKNDKVIMWLGDIAGLPEEEQYYLRSENIDSDHDIASEFYAGQIDIEWGNLSSEQEIFEARSRFEQKVLTKHHIVVHKCNEEVINIIKNIQRPIYWNEKGVHDAIVALNKVCVEAINEDELRKAILFIDDKADLKNLKGLKLLEKYMGLKKKVYVEKKYLLTFFVLYDFRQVLSHLMSKEASEEIMESCYSRLNVQDKNDYKEIYEKIVSGITETYNNLIQDL